MATKLDSTIIIQVKAAIDTAGEPLRFNDIRERLPGDTNIDSLRVTLSMMVRNKIIAKVKYLGTSSFYCRPDWVNKQGKVNIPDWDPHWKNKKASKTTNR